MTKSESLSQMTKRGDHYCRWQKEGIIIADDKERGSLLQMAKRGDHYCRWQREGIIIVDGKER